MPEGTDPASNRRSARAPLTLQKSILGRVRLQDVRFADDPRLKATTIVRCQDDLALPVASLDCHIIDVRVATLSQSLMDDLDNLAGLHEDNLTRFPR